jgi:hypothetical protein
MTRSFSSISKLCEGEVLQERRELADPSRDGVGGAIMTWIL